MRIVDLPGWSDIRLDGHDAAVADRRRRALRCGGIMSVVFVALGSDQDAADAAANTWAASTPVFAMAQRYIEHGQLEIVDHLRTVADPLLDIELIPGVRVRELMIAELTEGV